MEYTDDNFNVFPGDMCMEAREKKLPIMLFPHNKENAFLEIGDQWSLINLQVFFNWARSEGLNLTHIDPTDISQGVICTWEPK